MRFVSRGWHPPGLTRICAEYCRRKRPEPWLDNKSGGSTCPAPYRALVFFTRVLYNGKFIAIEKERCDEGRDESLEYFNSTKRPGPGAVKGRRAIVRSDAVLSDRRRWS